MSDRTRRDVKRMMESMSVADLRAMLDECDFLASETARLRAEVEGLTARLAAAERERDEARAELREARIHLSVARREIDQSRASRPLLNPGPTLHGSTITEIATDRDRLAAEVRRLTAERDAAEHERDEALRYHESNEVEYRRLAERLTDQRDTAIRERDEARAEVERMRATLTTVRQSLVSLRTVIATSSRDWSLHAGDAWIWGVLWGWGPLDDVRDTDAMPEVAERHRWNEETQARLQRYAKAIDAALSTPATTEEKR